MKALALALPADAWNTVTWREGSNDDMTSRFARVRVRPAYQDYKRTAPHPEEWLLVEWAGGRGGADQTLVLDPPPRHLSRRDGRSDQIALARIERDYQDLKQEVGLGHYEGRGWRAFPPSRHLVHRGLWFLISERETIPPSGPDSRPGDRPTCLIPRLPTQRRPRFAPERHVPNSIATLRLRLTSALARSLQRCPCCHAYRNKTLMYL